MAGTIFALSSAPEERTFDNFLVLVMFTVISSPLEFPNNLTLVDIFTRINEKLTTIL